MSNCLFCKIINKEIPAKIIFENDFIIVFQDIHPKAPVHLLMVPKQHIALVNELNTVNIHFISEIFLQVKNIAKEQGIDQTGYRLVVNSGPDSGQEVQHLHWHLLGGKKLAGIG